MSQSRAARKQPVSIHGDTLLRSRCPITKASGDTRTGPNQANHRSRSKNKIPKSLRYDLENALVGLCDVWFEEIKPHLLRNNIKVHVHGAMQSGIAGVPSGDPASGLLPPGAPGCSHVDPGVTHPHQRSNASCAGCCTTQRTASRARCRRRPAQDSASPHPRAIDTTTKNPRNDPVSSRPHGVRNRCCSPPARVPRLCRTHSTMTPVIVPRLPQRMVHTAVPTVTRRDRSFLHHTSKKKKTKNKWTQTDNIKQEEKPVRKSQASSLLDRHTGTTTMLPQKHVPRSRKKRRTVGPLFSDDLIDIIAEKHDKKLRVLFTSPHREEYPSIMNLVQSPNQQNIRCKKSPPWR